MGQQVGSFFNAIGMELGSAQRELNYSAAKAMTFYTVNQNWTLSAGISAISKKLSILFVGAKSVDCLCVMGEVGAHFTRSFHDVKLTGDVGARVFYGGQIQSAWFGQVSLISRAVKTSALYHWLMRA